MKRILVTLFFAVASLCIGKFVFAQDVCQQQDPCAGKTAEERVSCYESVISTCDKTRETLSAQITFMNSRIELTTLRIKALQSELTKLNNEIEELANEITRLEELLTKRLELVIYRIPESYKRSVTPNFGIIFLSSNISDFISRIKYVSRVQQEDAQLLFQLKSTQNNYAERKDIREKKKTQREQLKVQFEKESNDLVVQKRDKQILLEQTNNSEATYQNLLAQAREEYKQIQGIIAGGGSESKVGEVKKGDKIASVIRGSSCNSTGTHLHFTISKNGITENPFNYLKSVSYTNNSEGDPFTPSGNWDWPIDPPIQFNQGYGYTWYVRVYRPYPFHNGIDISGPSLDVKAVQDGTLYRGFYSGNCRLQYVKLEHKDTGIKTFYLHVNYF